jgi:RNA recognition motif-containing protein
VWFRSIATT